MALSTVVLPDERGYCYRARDLPSPIKSREGSPLWNALFWVAMPREIDEPELAHAGIADAPGMVNEWRSKPRFGLNRPARPVLELSDRSDWGSGRFAQMETTALGSFTKATKEIVVQRGQR
jgi:hypothetical protein